MSTPEHDPSPTLLSGRYADIIRESIDGAAADVPAERAEGRQSR